MRKITICIKILLLFIITVSCSDEAVDIVKSDAIQSELQLTPAERSKIGEARAETQGLSRWDAPWWDMSNKQMAEILRASTGEVLISFKEPNALAGVNNKGKVLVSEEAEMLGIEAIKALGAKILRRYKLHPSVLAEIPINIDLIAAIRSHPRVDIFEPNVKGSYISETTWNVERVNAPDVWNQTDGTGIDLLIIDSGVSNSHSDLNPDVIQACDGSNGIDQIGHGTHVAGIVAATKNGQSTVGVAHGVDLWSSKVGTSAPQTAYVVCAVEFGRINNVEVMNMSLSLTHSSVLTDEINDAYNQDDIVLVAAAGNTNGGAVTYPANLSTVIAVTATDINDDPASFSAVGSEIEIAAPGVDIESTCLGGGTCQKSGTSMAAPHVAAAAALLKAADSTWTNSQIRNELNSSATPLPAHSSDEVGHGLLNIEAALNTSPPPPPPVSASISGPPSLMSGSSGTYTVTVSGGTPPYSYQWYYKDNQSDVWSLAAASASYVHTALNPSTDYIRVRVEDSNNDVDNAYRTITVFGLCCQ